MSLPVVYIHTTDLAANDTSATFVLNNAISLADQGQVVTLILINRSRDSPEDILKRNFDLSIPKDLTIVGFNPMIRSKFFFYVYVRKWVARLKHRSIIVTRSHGVLPYLFFREAKNHLHIFETHDFFMDLSIRDDIQHWMNKRSRVEKKYFPKLHGMICLNRFQKELYSERLDLQHIAIFPTGLNRLFHHEAETSKRIIYVGSLEKRLGIRNLASLIKNVDASIEILVVGGKNNEEIRDFENLFEGELPDNVKLLGWLNKHDLNKTLSKGGLALLPHEDTFFTRYMTVPLKLFDYFSHGIPIISTDLPAMKEWIDDKTGFLANWNNLDDILTFIDSYFEDDQLRRNMSKAVLKKAGSMTWTRRAEDQIKYFKELEEHFQ